MRTALQIARNELMRMVYSPIAWLMLAVFIIQTAVVFVFRLHQVAEAQMFGAGGQVSVTVDVFATALGFFQRIFRTIYLFVPLVTMGLFSREFQSGSIKLLLSSPISSLTVVAGKYLSMVAYCFALSLVLVGFMLTAGFVVESLDYLAVMTGILGVFLLACTYSAIGLFMSTLTSHQIVAAISTFGVLAGLTWVGSYGQTIPIIGDIAFWISLSGRLEYFRDGLISSSDVFYFLSVIALMLSLSVLKLTRKQRSEGRVASTIRYSCVVVLVILFGYVTSLPALTVYWDTTRTKWLSIMPESVDLLSKLEGPIRVTTYANVNEYRNVFHVTPVNQRFDQKQRFDRYIRHHPKMDFDYVYYYGPVLQDYLKDQYPGASDKEIAQEFARRQKMDFSTILSVSDLRGSVDVADEGFRVFRTVEWNGKSALSRLYDDIAIFPTEVEFMATLKRLLVGPMKVGFVTGHGERSTAMKGPDSYHRVSVDVTYRYALISQGFDVVEISLDAAVPDDIDLLIIADQVGTITGGELRNFENYIDRGGNLLITVEPRQQAAVISFVDALGVAVSEASIPQRDSEFEADFIQTAYSPEANALGFENPLASFASIRLLGAADLQWDDGKLGEFEVTPVLVAENSNQKNPSSVALAMTRERKDTEQRIMILGDADVFSNAHFNSSALPSVELEFWRDLIGWLANYEYPVRMNEVDFPDKEIDIGVSGLARVRAIYYWIMPLILLVVAATIINKRRRA